MGQQLPPPSPSPSPPPQLLLRLARAAETAEGRQGAQKVLLAYSLRPYAHPAYTWVACRKRSPSRSYSRAPFNPGTSAVPGTIVQSHGQSRRPDSQAAAATAWHTYGSQAPSRIAESGLRTSFQLAESIFHFTFL